MDRLRLTPSVPMLQNALAVLRINHPRDVASLDKAIAFVSCFSLSIN
jgi:hypothetical protein